MLRRPSLAACIGANGQMQVRRLLQPSWVALYMAEVVRAVARLQRGEDHARWVALDADDVRLRGLRCCLEKLEVDGSGTGARVAARHACVTRALRVALRERAAKLAHARPRGQRSRTPGQPR